MRRLDSIRRSIVRAQMRVGVSEERARITKQDYLKDVPDGEISYREWLGDQEVLVNRAVEHLTRLNKDVDFRKRLPNGERRYQWIRHGVFIDLLNPKYEEFIY